MRKFVILAVGLLVLCGQVIRLPVFLVPFKTTAILPNDAGLAVLAVLVLLWKLYNRRLLYRDALFTWPIAVFLIAGVVSLGVNTVYYNLHSYEVFISSLYLGRWALYCTVYFIFLDVVRTREQVVWAAGVFGVVLLVFAAFGIVQAFTMPNFAFVVHPEDTLADWDPQRSRLVSTFLDPNLAGCLIAVGLIFAIVYLMEGYRNALLPIAVLGAALILTYSRGGVLSFGVGVFYLILTGKHKWRVFGGIVVAFAILFLLAPYLVRHAEEYNRFTLSDASALHRVESWLVCFRLIRDNFFFGIGFNTLPYVLPRYGYLAGGGSAFGLDGGLLAIFALSGVLGLAGYCYLIGKVLLTSRWIYANSDDRLYRVIAKGASASLLVIVTSSFFTSALLYLFIMEFYWVAFALLNVLYILSKRPATNPARRRPYPSVQKTANFGRRPVPVTSSIR